MSPANAYQTIRGELAKYSARLAEKPEIIVANKADLTDAMAGVEELRSATGQEVLAVSAVTGTGIADLVECMWTRVRAEKERAAPVTLPPSPHPDEPNDVPLVGATW
jgi:GTP-binding protein